MRITPWVVALTCTLTACSSSNGPTDSDSAADRMPRTEQPFDTPARDAATSIVALISERTRGGIDAAEAAADVDAFIDAFVDLGTTLRDIRSTITETNYPEVTLRFAFDHLPLLVDVIGSDGNYCVDANEDTTNAVAAVGPGPCRTDTARLANVGSLFSGDRERVADHLAGALGQIYTGHVRPLVDAAASSDLVALTASAASLADAAETLLGALYGWTFTVIETDEGVLVELGADGLFACGLATDTGRTAAVGGPCPRDGAGALLSMADTVESAVAYNYGDDVKLDELWDACAGGALESCDALFDASPVGSLYEAFGASCGAVGVTDQYCARAEASRST